MMFDTLYLFLLRHKRISLPGIGVVSMQIHPAKTKFIDREVHPPTHSFQFSKNDNASTKKIDRWAAYHLDISEQEAADRFLRFVSVVAKQIDEGKEVVWNGVGTYRKGSAGDVEFIPEKKELAFNRPVAAEKVIRENAKHVVVVGEREKTGSDISEIMADQEEATDIRSNWWILPVALIVLSLIFLGWYFSENGVKASSSSNTEKSTPNEAPSGFYFSK